MKKKHKFIFVVGGVMSGVGKGIAASSLGIILQSKGYKVNPIKIDPYLNVDAGNMNPVEHGEVFVLDAGTECDQDMGNYERFMGVTLTPEDYMTSGMVYKHVIDRERSLGYGGKCVEAIPHVTGEIIRRIKNSADKSGSDITLVEIGGTVGDYQNVLFIEAARTMKLQNPDNVVFIMVSYLPVPGTLGEMKTRPTQNAIHQLNSYGVHPDIIIARGVVALDERRKEKIALSCAIKPDHVISAPDIESVYDVPINFERDNLGNIVLKDLHLRPKNLEADLKDWKKFVSKIKNYKGELNIAVVGKYFDSGDFVFSDAYVSVIEAVKYSCYWQDKKAKLTWINSKLIETGEYKVSDLGKFDGIIVPGGFGSAGIEGVITSIKYARENKIPYFGLCYGMQLMTIEYARNVLGWEDANTAEISPKAKHLIIDVMPDQKQKIASGNYGGSMRLGAYKAQIKPNTVAREAYKEETVSERHRHRYEVNPEYIEPITKAGLVFSGTSPDGHLMEIAELPKSKHPFFLGTQFHPEFKARPLNPHPLFTAFVKAAKKRSEGKK